jgi:Flp pilus assembly protein TadD
MPAVVLCQQRDREGATWASERGTALRPQVAPYRLVRGNAELADGRHENARRSLLRALELEPAFAEAHYRLGLAYHALLRFADAAVAYRAALQLASGVAQIDAALDEALRDRRFFP